MARREGQRRYEDIARELRADGYSVAEKWLHSLDEESCTDFVYTKTGHLFSVSDRARNDKEALNRAVAKLNERSKQDNRSYRVYVIGPASGRPVKIGYASDTAKRLSGIQNGNHEELHIHYEFCCDGRLDAERVEKAAHSVLRDRRIRGEWFDVDADAAADAIKFVDGPQVFAAKMLLRKGDEALLKHGVTPESLIKLKEVALRTTENNGIR